MSINEYTIFTNRFLKKYENQSFLFKNRAYILFYFLIFLFLSMLIFFIQMVTYKSSFYFDLYYSFTAIMTGIIISLYLLRRGAYYIAANLLILTILSTLMIVTLIDWIKLQNEKDIIIFQTVMSLQHFYPVVIVLAMMFCKRKFIIIISSLIIIFSFSIIILIKLDYNPSFDTFTYTTAFSFISLLAISFIALFSRKLADDTQLKLEDHLNNLETIVEARTDELKTALNEKDSINSVLKEKTEELLILKNKAEIQARTDILTGMNNRFAFMEKSVYELNRAIRYVRKLSLLIIDIDHFKTINDTMGHAAGDIALKDVTVTIRKSLRSNDFAARIGGEEFAVLLPETNIEKALSVGEKIRDEIEKTIKSGEKTITCSIGIASIKNSDSVIDTILMRADEALYKAKNRGRNRVEIED